MSRGTFVMPVGIGLFAGLLLAGALLAGVVSCGTRSELRGGEAFTDDGSGQGPASGAAPSRRAGGRSPTERLGTGGGDSRWVGDPWLEPTILPTDCATPGAFDSWDAVPFCSVAADQICRDDFGRLLVPPDVMVRDMAALGDELAVMLAGTAGPVSDALAGARGKLRVLTEPAPGGDVLQASHDGFLSVHQDCADDCGIRLGLHPRDLPPVFSVSHPPEPAFFAVGAIEPLVLWRTSFLSATGRPNGGLGVWDPRSPNRDLVLAREFDEGLLGLSVGAGDAYVVTDSSELVIYSFPDLLEVDRRKVELSPLPNGSILHRRGGGVYWYGERGDGGRALRSVGYLGTYDPTPELDISDAVSVSIELEEVVVATDHDISFVRNDAREPIATTNWPGSIEQVIYDEPHVYVLSRFSEGQGKTSSSRQVIDALTTSCGDQIH